MGLFDFEYYSKIFARFGAFSCPRKFLQFLLNQSLAIIIHLRHIRPLAFGAKEQKINFIKLSI